MNTRAIIVPILGVILVSLVTLACSSTDPSLQPVNSEASEEINEMVVREEPYILKNIPDFTIEITSQAVTRRGRLNKYYTCEGADVSPDLSWSGAPDETRSFVVLMEDPASDEIEGGVLWTHWILYSIPSTVTSLPEELPTTKTLDNGAVYGTNDYGNTLYSGPCPEPTIYIKVQGCLGASWCRGNQDTIPAKVRPYHFYIYALDKEIVLVPGATRNQVLQEIESHIIGAGKLAPEFRSTRNSVIGGGS